MKTRSTTSEWLTSMNGTSKASSLAVQPPIMTLMPTLTVPYIAVELAISALSISGNLMVCLLVLCNRRLRTISNYFLVSLAVADLSVGALVVPCAIMTNLGLPNSSLDLCVLTLSMLLMLTQSSIFCLLAIATERYVAIILPFHYQRLVRSCNAKLVILLTWVLGFLLGPVPLMGWHMTPAQAHHCYFNRVVDMTYMVYFNFFVCVLAPLAAMFVIYARIFRTVRRQVRKIASAAGQMACTTPQAKRQVGIRKEMRQAISLFLLLFPFVLCWMPIHVVNCVSLLCPLCPMPESLMLAAIVLSHANSAVNPLLYVYRMRAFRRNCRRLLLCGRNPRRIERGSGELR